ncbi:DNA-directed DNA polymerase, family B, exonuclease domain containing protein [uncultured Caudovirales phage]|uniref:DNA-directed DNA polymerase n=1 Tax=uncultured Caudovirales phage TaxID=2100421 RepID=A0A6J5Q2D7_9CAUD|nr:DNA-directed DNA polymerase, family B, exonuclease domain containing protein [uncultured Caudovirales phage]CAB4193880.1 DNA-directed DNA polymerase, family B, exonuclease domain containing protein [uncultured Caudovirales phage]
MIIGAEVLNDNTLTISYYNDSGKIEFIKKRLMDHEMYNWVESKTPTATKNWNGKFVKKGPTQGQYMNQFRVQELIQEKLTAEELELVYNFDNLPKKTYLDIEIKLIDDSFPEADKARMPVGLISFCNEDNITYILSILNTDDQPDGLTSDQIVQMEKDVNAYFRKTVLKQPSDAALFNQDFKIKYKFFNSEDELMAFYFHKIMPHFNFVTGWNVTDFDWKYLMNRGKNLKIDMMEKMPTRSTVSKVKIPTHLGVLDYMQVFEKMKPYKVVENYKLDYIADLVLGTAKLHHPYSSFMEFQKDLYLFTMYNVIDVILVKLIEDKLALMDVAFAMANVAQVEVNKVFSPVYIAEILMCREFLNKNQKMMKLPWGEEVIDGTYAGAYVKDPIPGYYNAIACYDFSSMYPNIQIQFNISPDTYLGKTDTVKKDGTEIPTKNDTMFSSKGDSVARKILTRLYDERIKTQGEIKTLKNSK